MKMEHYEQEGASRGSASGKNKCVMYIEVEVYDTKRGKCTHYITIIRYF
jgi:hypothetical protein